MGIKEGQGGIVRGLRLGKDASAVGVVTENSRARKQARSDSDAPGRVPPNGNWICNVALGGRDSPISVSNREREIVKDVSNILAKKGVFIFGIDTLIDNYGQRVLSEINVMSIGGLIQAEAATEKKILKRYASLFWKYVDTYLGG